MPTNTELAALYARADKYLALGTAAIQRTIDTLGDGATDELFDRITFDAQRMGAERADKILARG